MPDVKPSENKQHSVKRTFISAWFSPASWRNSGAEAMSCVANTTPGVLFFTLYKSPSVYTALKQIHLIHWASKGFVESRVESLFKHIIKQMHRSVLYYSTLCPAFLTCKRLTYGVFTATCQKGKVIDWIMNPSREKGLEQAFCNPVLNSF